MKRVISLLVVIAVGAGVYWYARSDASERVRREALKMAEVMDLSNDQRIEVRRLINAAHPQAFSRALHATRNVGGKFDAAAYYDELCRLIISRATSEGDHTLARKIAEEKEWLRFDVVER